MKIRKGFVSNSSTSSYIIFGVMLEAKDLKDDLSDEKQQDLEDEETLYLENGMKVDCDEFYTNDDNGNVYVGRVISVGSENSGESWNVQSLIEEAEEILNFYKLDSSDVHMYHVYTGM